MTATIRILPLSAVLLLVGTLAGCGLTADGDSSVDGGSAGGGGDSAMTVSNCGREVTLDAAPENVLVIGGEAGTLVAAADGGERVGTFMPLIGEPLGEAESALAGAEQMPLQTITDLSREVLLDQEPDLVVTFGLSGFTPEDLEAAGIPTLVIAGYCGGFGAGQSEVEDPIQGIYDDIVMLGQVFESSEVAEQSVADLQERVADVAEPTGNAAGGSAAAVFAVDPGTVLGAYGAKSMIHQQMTLLGLSNVYGDTDERYFEPNSETLVDLAPDQIVALYEAGDTSEDDARAAVTQRPALADVPAVATEDVLVLNFYYAGHGTLAVDGLEMLAEQQ